MLTRQNKFIKWASYALALVLVTFLENSVFARFPVWGVIPVMIPLAAAMAGVFEGPAPGAAFGIGVGVMCQALYFRGGGWLVLGCAAAGLLAGLIARYAFGPTLASAFVSSLAALLLLDGARVLLRLAQGAALPGLLRIAGPEILYSLAASLLVFLIFRGVYRRVGGDALA